MQPSAYSSTTRRGNALQRRVRKRERAAIFCPESRADVIARRARQPIFHQRHKIDIDIPPGAPGLVELVGYLPRTLDDFIKFDPRGFVFLALWARSAWRALFRLLLRLGGGFGPQAVDMGVTKTNVSKTVSEWNQPRR